MPNNKWTDESIEDLLKDFPAIKDNRSKEEVYNRLVQKEKGPKRPKRPKTWLPLLVAALAFITIGILVASIISQNGIDSAQNQESSSSESADSSVTTEEGAMEETDELPAAEESGGDGSGQFSIAQVGPQRTAVYEESLEDQTVMTLGLTENAFVIPVSFLIPNDQIEEAFGGGSPSSLELYQKYAADIDETQLGFDEYHPYVGKLEKTATGIRHLLPPDHQYDMASASMGVYFNTLSETFADAPEIEVVNEDGSPAEFSEVGPVEPLVPEQKSIAYYAFTSDSGKVYLAPGYDMPFTEASEAIKSLAESPNDFYHATIPQDVNFQVSETAEYVEVDFEEGIDLSKMKRLEAVRMIESLILTADAFDKEVEVTGLKPETWNGFDFSQPLPVPVAPNLIEWTLK